MQQCSYILRKGIYNMQLSPSTLIVFLLTRHVLNSTPTAACSYHGTSDANGCNCYTGYIGDDCSQLDFVTQTDSERKNLGMQHSWCGSVINTTFNATIPKYIFVGSYMAEPPAPNNLSYTSGMGQWYDYSTCAIGESNSIYGPFKLVGFFADKGSKIPYWGHNCRGVVTCINDQECAIEIDLLYKIPRGKTSPWLYTSFAIPTPLARLVGNFPSDMYDQRVAVAHYKLTKTSDIKKRNQEIYKVFTNVSRADISPPTININQQFTYTDISLQIPKFQANIVNPTRLIDPSTNMPAMVKFNGTNHFVYVTRFKAPTKKSTECLWFFVGPSNKYIWEVPEKYVLGHMLCMDRRNIEDAYCWLESDPNLKSTGQTAFCIMHDFKACGPSNTRYFCGSITSLRMDNLTNANIANPMQATSKAWSTPKRTYAKYIDGLQAVANPRQRPWLFFCKDNHGKPYICALYTSAIFSDGKYKTVNGRPYWDGQTTTSYPVAINGSRPKPSAG